MDLLDYIERIGDDPPTPSRVSTTNIQIGSNFCSEFLEWPNSEAESANFSAPEQYSLPEAPSTSGSSAGIFQPISDTLRVYFPDTFETIEKPLLEILGSSRSDNDIQCELIDLLGVELPELAREVLEKRNKIVYEMKSKELARVEEAEQTRAKPSATGFLQTVSVQSTSQNEKELKLELNMAQKEIQRQRQLEIGQMKCKPSLLPGGPRVEEIYPYVFDARIQSGHTIFDINGMKFALPEGSKRDTYKTHESVLVPPANKGDIEQIQHVYIKDMDELGQKGFKGFEKLNVIQSIVFEQAYKTKENLLICAPTGAGKTNIAMLTILNTIHEHQNAKGEIMKDDFKIIYIAPIQALATEMTESFGKRLAPLGLKVKELTGDTQLSRNEVAGTQMLVLTPEKWDVITRKSSLDNSLIDVVRLLIIDEVHLLHDERGPVIETLVARTLRQVEMSQSGIRIVGLSATLVNYVDVARFLRVNPYKGMFYFDGRFRPVPLTQKFIGTRKTGNFRDNTTLMDNVCYDEVIDFVKRGHQVLVFVHTRNGTAKLGEAFCARASVLGQMDLFLPKDKTSSKYVQADKAINKCRNRFQISPLFQRGFGIHHVGLCRQDRILMERCFAEGHISVLFCTTLVWRVNLPAHAVVIKGTDVFDAEKGVFTDLDVLDVQQIFGRAGLPQFENEGHGIIITTRDKIDKYLTMLVHQNPIESNFYTRLHDNLNAEVALGTVSTVDEGVKWLTYTYMYTRAVKNPVAYGIAYNAIERDPNLRDHFGNVIREAAMQLDQNEMIRFDLATECLNSTDLGRIASNFYVKYETIQLLNEAEKGVGLPVTFTAFMPDDMVIGLISMATEFANIKCREEEIGDLEELMSYGCMMNVRGGGLASVAGKVNVLLQSLISRTSTRNLALMSEQLYVQQNAGRLCRAMFEMVLKNRWSQAANAFLGIAKCVEKQMWMNQCPLRQFIQKIDIPITWIEKIERKKARESDLLELSPKVLGYLFSCDGDRLYTYLRYLPRMGVKARSKPNTCNMLQVIVTVTPAFIWNDTIHGKSGLQSFFLVLENLNENLIIHQERFGIGKKKVMRKKPQFIVFTIPIVDCQLTNNFRLRLASEYFVTEDVVVPLSLQNCILSKSSKDNSLELLHPFSLIHPSSKMRHFPLLDLPLVSKEHVLAMMDPYEWINFSLASRKAYSAVKTFLKNKSFLTVIISTEAEPYIVITGKHESWNFEWTQTLSMVGYKTNRTGDRKVNTLYKYSENPIESLKLDFGYMREIIAIELVYVTFDMKSFPNQNKSITNWLRFHPTCRIEITSSNEQCDDDLKYAMENLVVTDSMWLRCVDFSQDFQMELPRTPRIRIDKSSFISFEQLLKLENQSISLFRPRLSAEDINGFVRNWMSCRTHLHLKTFDIDLSNFESMNIIMDVPHEETNDSHIANSFDESFQCRCGVREGFDIKRSDGKLARVSLSPPTRSFARQLSFVLLLITPYIRRECVISRPFFSTKSHFVLLAPFLRVLLGLLVLVCALSKCIIG